MEVTTREEMVALILAYNIELVQVECEDTNGVSRGFTLDVDFFLSQLDDGIPIVKGIYAFRANAADILPGTGTLEEISFGNCAMYPDISTFKVLPFDENVASVLAYVRVDNGNPESPLVSVSPRNLCKLQLDKLKSLGIQLYGAFEFEFYLLSKESKMPLTDNVNAFSTQSQRMFLPFVKDAIQAMKRMSIVPEVHHSECGPGQQEITCSPKFGIHSADDAFRFKHLMKEIATRHGAIATFMSKPYQDVAGSSGHYNHSLWDAKGCCVMYDADRPYGLSEITEQWLAGLRSHSRALTCLAAPTSNCYERLKPGEGLFAPLNNSWGFDNRTVAYRIKNKQSSKLYIECRMPGAAVNPYLLVAGCIAAGMDGIKRKLKLDVEPYVGDVTKATSLSDNIASLPGTLSSALECFLEDALFTREFGTAFVKCFSATRRAECRYVEEAATSGGDIFTWYRDNYAEAM